MLSNEKIEQYKELKKLDFSLNFKINKADKNKMDKIAKKKGLTTSELLRILIREFIKEQKKEGLKHV